ncbi:hypothetical protein [uncultured Kordia sp.]|uniref:hypothetical protein n=1 Tax=uncultured Kordia sp. TaxID=507699 RepID=UPI0026161525|nr:hypothetical protein [uncultured Kordia sp.]
MKKIILGASALLFAAALTLNVNTQQEITVNEALAGGTCCPGVGSCYISSNGTFIPNYWLRIDGKSCSGKDLSLQTLGGN